MTKGINGICPSTLFFGGLSNAKTATLKNKPNGEKETYLLIHSAWLGAWQWKNVTNFIEENGHKVIAPDLAGHGSDKTPAKTITMEHYVRAITDILDACEGPVVLVGHSFNGITISRVAELRPHKIVSLVYLAAFLLPQGGSFFKAVKNVEGSKAVENFYLSEDNSCAFVREAELQNAFAHDIPEAAFEAAKAYIVPEPAAPLMYELEITNENYGQVLKYYIECTEDRAIPIENQRDMYQGVVNKVYSLDSSHTPNFSQAENLANILLNIQNDKEQL